MKKILLSDFGNITETSFLCNKYNLGVDSGSFRHCVSLNQDLINENLIAYENAEIYSIHGNISDLIFESNNIETVKKGFNTSYEISVKLNCKNIVFHNGS